MADFESDDDLSCGSSTGSSANHTNDIDLSFDPCYANNNNNNTKQLPQQLSQQQMQQLNQMNTSNHHSPRRKPKPRTVKSLELNQQGNCTIRISVNQTNSNETDNDHIDDDDDDDDDDMSHDTHSHTQSNDDNIDENDDDDDDDMSSDSYTITTELLTKETKSTATSDPDSPTTPANDLSNKYRHLHRTTPANTVPPPPLNSNHKIDNTNPSFHSTTSTTNKDDKFSSFHSTTSTASPPDAAMETLRSEFAAVDARLGALSDDILNSPPFVGGVTSSSSGCSESTGYSSRRGNPAAGVSGSGGYSPLGGGVRSVGRRSPSSLLAEESRLAEEMLERMERRGVGGEERESLVHAATPKSDAPMMNGTPQESNGNGVTVKLFDIDEVVMVGTEISPLGGGRGEEKSALDTEPVPPQAPPPPPPTSPKRDPQPTNNNDNEFGIFPPPADGTSFCENFSSPIPSPVRSPAPAPPSQHDTTAEEVELDDDDAAFFPNPNRRSAIVSRGISEGSIQTSPRSCEKSVTFQEPRRPSSRQQALTRSTKARPTSKTRTTTKPSNSKVAGQRKIVRPPTRHWREAPPPRKLPGQATITQITKRRSSKARVAAEPPVRSRPSTATTARPVLHRNAPKPFLRKSTAFSPIPKSKKQVRQRGDSVGAGDGIRLELNPPVVTRSSVKCTSGVDAWKGAMTVEDKRVSLLVNAGEGKGGEVTPDLVSQSEQPVVGSYSNDTLDAILSDNVKELPQIDPTIHPPRKSSIITATIPQSPKLRTKAMHGNRRYSNLGKRDADRTSGSATLIQSNTPPPSRASNQQPVHRALSVPKGPKLRTQAIHGDRRYSSLGRREAKPHPIPPRSTSSPRKLTIPKGPNLQTQAIRGDRNYSNLGKREESMMTTPDSPTRKIRPRCTTIPLPKGPTLRTQSMHGNRIYSSSGRRDETIISSATPPPSPSNGKARTLTIPKGPKLRTSAKGERSYSNLGKRDKRLSPFKLLHSDDPKVADWVNRKLTVPKAPNLSSPRNRAKLRMEEDKENNSLCNTSQASNLSQDGPHSLPFKAKPIGAGVFGSKFGSSGCIGVRKITKRKVTSPRPFRLLSESRVRGVSASPSMTVGNEKLKTTVPARSMPDRSVRPQSSSVGGVFTPLSPPKKRRLTTPKPFRFQTMEREKVHVRKAVVASPTAKGVRVRAGLDAKGEGQKSASHFTFDRPKSLKRASPRKLTEPRPFSLSGTNRSPSKKSKVSKEDAFSVASTALPPPPTFNQLNNGTSSIRHYIQPPHPPPLSSHPVVANPRSATILKPFELRTSTRATPPAKTPVTHQFRARPLPKHTAQFRARPMPTFKKPPRQSMSSSSTSTSKIQQSPPTTKGHSAASIKRQNQTMMREMADKREISTQSRVKRMEMAELLVQRAEQLQRDSDLANGTTDSLDNILRTVTSTTSTDTGVTAVEMKV